jgi:hypothetical protein
MNHSLPVTVLTALGTLTVLIGFFAAGELLVAVLGFGALVAAGLIQALDTDRHGAIVQPLRKI